jgi:hypothetical protein
VFVATPPAVWETRITTEICAKSPAALKIVGASDTIPRMKTRLVPSLVLLSILSLSAQGEVTRRDGNSWIAMSPLEKAYYVTGFLDGTTLGRNFTVWGCLGKGSDKKATPEQVECVQNVGGSFQEYFDQYIAHVTVGQLVEGLDVVYKDYRNRKILTVSAVWIVLNEIAGTPRQTIDTLIENSRQHAND